MPGVITALLRRQDVTGIRTTFTGSVSVLYAGDGAISISRAEMMRSTHQFRSIGDFIAVEIPRTSRAGRQSSVVEVVSAFPGRQGDH
jgi:hypothetical protein